jgi:predicted transcriptional regulator
MDFNKAVKLGHFISRDYAEGFFELLVNYRDISASEAASRLNLHIRTAQDFLEAMAALDIVDKKEVYEKKRPYFRYALKTGKISLEIDLEEFRKRPSEDKMSKRIREKKNTGARFVTARGGGAISNVIVWSGEGRERKEARINLTAPQGQFLYHLPFPDGEPLTVAEIMRKAEIDNALINEVLDLVGLLDRNDVIETIG